VSTGEVAAEPGPTTVGRLRGSGGAVRDYVVVGVLVALFVTLSVASDAFLTSSNLLTIVEQVAVVGIVACGMTIVLIAGGFDLSVGAIYAVAGIVAAKLAPSLGAPAALLAGALSGAVLGGLNGLLVTVGRINSFIATIASAIVIRGIAVAITGGFLVSVSEPSFQALGNDEILGVNCSIWAFAVFAALCALLLSRTLFGRLVYAVGGNPEAARMSGVRVGLIRAATFSISGFAAGLAGIIAASRVAQGQADVGATLPLDAIAAVAIGGTSIMGGEGAVWRTVVGVLLLELMTNGFTLLGVETAYRSIAIAVFIIAAVGADSLLRGRR
jgi:ribose transport system permease protein